MIVILHNVRSIHNVGSIFRTADAVGVEKIYLAGFTPSPLDRFGAYRKEFQKTALGAERTMPWEKVDSAARVIGKLKREGYAIFAVEQSEKSIPYYKMKRKTQTIKHTVLICGNEVRGIPASILKFSDMILEIPMKGKKESLNVAIAFGIVAYFIVFGYNNRT